MNPQDKFYFYNTSIGDLTKLMRKYSVPDQVATQGFITNAFGVKINPDHLPLILKGREGSVEPLPIPANWHADIAEFGSALRAVDLAVSDFTAIELGCGWGCWLNITGLAAKRKGLNVRLIGVEGDGGHVRFAHESLTENGFSDSEYTIHHGIASGKEGLALFPLQTDPGIAWGLEPLFDLSVEQLEELLQTGNYQQLKQITLNSILPPDRHRVDLLHVDIQGGEVNLVRRTMDFLNEKVAMMLIGTHGRQIEGDLFDLLINSGWFLEVERPAVLCVGKNITTLVDGVQLWRNPRLISDQQANGVDSFGELEILDAPTKVQSKASFDITIRLANKSIFDWNSEISFPVRLSYHWIDEKGDYVVFDGIRTDLSNNTLDRNSYITQLMKVTAPSNHGKFKLVATVLQEGIKWFDDPDFTADAVDVYIE